MKYFKSADGKVYGYDLAQTALIDAAVTAGWEDISGAWPTPPTLAKAKAVQVAIINAACEGVLSAITAPYPYSEIASWDQQLAEAQAWTANNSSSTPLLSAIIAANGATLSDQVASVLAKSAAFKAASGTAIGKRQLLTDQINAATSADQVNAITW